MKHNKLFCLGLVALMAVSAAALAACGDGEGDGPAPVTPTARGTLVPTETYVMPEEADAVYRTTNVAVHDPSVFYDEATKKYYAFGSHFAVASSSDLVEWKQEVSDNEDDKLFTGGVKQAMPETMQRASNQSDAWAPDVEYYNGKYYMYLAFTQQMYTDKSVMSRVEADNVLGPYSNEKIILESVSSEAAQSGANKPNCIDNELFYDKDGRLWMVYGSFFGGIYIKELNNSGSNWGLPKESGLNDWGKLIWKGGYSEGVEGPYIFYNALTDYYYLMVSEANLFSNYNMRVARSKSPDGPYVDITGKDVAADGQGNKIAGNYKFARAGAENGYIAMGHNSVVQDATGRWFVVYHTRRIVEGGHNLMVNQLYFNEAGWPVMAPAAYVGEKFGLITQEQAAADYEIVLHSEQTVATVVTSENYTLKADGTIAKGTTADAGTWTVKQNYYVEITLGQTTYKGVVVPVWDMYSRSTEQKGVFGITAVSDAGQSLWALSK